MIHQPNLEASGHALKCRVSSYVNGKGAHERARYGAAAHADVGGGLQDAFQMTSVKVGESTRGGVMLPPWASSRVGICMYDWRIGGESRGCGNRSIGKTRLPVKIICGTPAPGQRANVRGAPRWRTFKASQRITTAAHPQNLIV